MVNKHVSHKLTLITCELEPQMTIQQA